MKSEAELVALLGEAPPASVSALPPETIDRLVQQIAAAKKRQDSEMEASVRTAIAGVPFAVRGIVKKALLG